jgi:hypothetical protein
MNCAAGEVEHIGRIHGVDQHVFFRFGLELLKSTPFVSSTSPVVAGEARFLEGRRLKALSAVS